MNNDLTSIVRAHSHPTSSELHRTYWHGTIRENSALRYEGDMDQSEHYQITWLVIVICYKEYVQCIEGYCVHDSLMVIVFTVARHVFLYMCTIPNVYDLRGYGFSYAYEVMFPVVSHYITIIPIHLVSQFLNRMKIDVTSNPVTALNIRSGAGLRWLLN